MSETQDPLQTIANHAHAILCTHYTQRETGLLYMYIDPHEVGVINLPTREQVLASIPNSNGFATPLENCNYASSQYLHTLLARFQVTRNAGHADEVRALYRGLMHLRRVSTSPTFVPRGVLPDGRTHYVDVSVDHMSYWIMAVWSYYRSSLSSVQERSEIRKALVEMAAGAEANGWKFCREDGRLSYWCDLLTPLIPRSRLVLLMLLGVAYDVSEDARWRRLYEEFRGGSNSDALEGVMDEHTWISSQTAWLLDTLLKIEHDPRYAEPYRRALRGIAESSVRQLHRYREYEPTRAWRDFQFRTETHRDVMFAAVGLALCPDAGYVAEHRELVDRALRHYRYRRDGKIVDLVDSIPRYYWILAERGLLPYEPALDVPGDPAIEPIPRDAAYPLNYGHWFDSLTRTYTGHAPDEAVPETQFHYVVY